MSLGIRLIEPRDYPLLEEFLYFAALLPQLGTPPPREDIYKPEIYVYIDGFGGKNDFGFVAEEEGQVIAAAWARLIVADGHVDGDTPELVVAVLPGHQGKGLGKMLITRLLGLLCERGYERVSLSVEKRNPAVRLYERLGFKAVQ